MGGAVSRDERDDSDSQTDPSRRLARRSAGARSLVERGEPARRRRRRGMRPRGYATIFAVSFGLTFTGSLIARAVHGNSERGAISDPGHVASPPADLAGPLSDATPEALPHAPQPALAAAEPKAETQPPAPAPAVPEIVLAHLPDARGLARGAADGQLVRVATAPADVPLAESLSDDQGPLQVEYTLDPTLTRSVVDLLRVRRVPLAHVIVLDPADGRVLTYVSSDPERFPASRTYPAASLIKVVTAAAALHHDRARAEQPCQFLGSPYVLTPERVNPPRGGQTVSLERALATSNNQCFAQLAVHALGNAALTDAILRFGFLQPPAPGHQAGHIDPGTDLYDLGKLGCGLAGTWITPLHAAQLAATLADGRLVQPRWIERVTDADGRELALPAARATRQVMTPGLAAELRQMLIETTESGTARRGFRSPRGGNRLGPVRVAGKTGSLSGTDPAGRYEWFAGVAPADDPKVAIAVVVVQQGRWSLHASQVAGEVLEDVFCGGGSCRPEPRVRSAKRDTEHLPGVERSAAAPPLRPAVHEVVSTRTPNAG